MTARARYLKEPNRLAPVETCAIPSPRAGELLLQIHATSINFHDLVGIASDLPNLTLPRVPFSDNSATVVAVGPDVSGFKEEDRVITGFFPDWTAGGPVREAMRTVLGDQIDGTLQTHLCVPARSVVRSPVNLAHDEIATLGCAGLTAWRAVVVEGALKPGQTVVVQGSGGVSLFALALAKKVGARVIMTSSSDAKLERGRALGADVLINYRENPEWDRAVLDATDGHGADLIVEVGGGATLARSVNALRFGGHLSVIGVLTGFEAASFPLAQVMIANQTVRGITVGSVRDLDDMCRAIEMNDLHPVIDSRFALDEVEGAIALMERQTHFGKIVIENAA